MVWLHQMCSWIRFMKSWLLQHCLRLALQLNQHGHPPPRRTNCGLYLFPLWQTAKIAHARNMRTTLSFHWTCSIFGPENHESLCEAFELVVNDAVGRDLYSTCKVRFHLPQVLGIFIPRICVLDFKESKRFPAQHLSSLNRRRTNPK